MHTSMVLRYTKSIFLVRMKQIGRYEVVEQIGRGAMGEVYRAILHGVADFQNW